MRAWLVRRVRIAWRLRRHAFLAGFGLVAASVVWTWAGAGAGVEELPIAPLPIPAASLAVSVLIAGTGFSVVALLLIAILPVLRSLVLIVWFVALACLVASGIGGSDSSVEIARLVVVFGLVVLLYVLPMPVVLTHRASRRLAAAPNAIRAVIDPRGGVFFDLSVEAVEPVAGDPRAFRIRYRKRGLNRRSGRLRLIEDAPDRLVMHLMMDGRLPLDVTVSITLAPEGEGTRVDYAERVRRAPVMAHAMMWLDRALADVLDDVEDAALGRPRRSRRALATPE